MMFTITVIKGIILIVMLCVTLIAIMLPLAFVSYIRHTHNTALRLRYQKWLSCLSCVAGGVFMGTCILDLFPDTQEQIDVLLDHLDVRHKFPVAEFIVVFGFLLVLCIEQIILEYKESSIMLSINEYESLDSDSNSSVSEERNQSDLSIGGVSDLLNISSTLSDINRFDNSSPFPGNVSCDPEDGHGHDHNYAHSIHQDTASHSPLRMYLLLLAISLHSIFEGLAIGLQKSIDNVVALFATVIFHKGLIAFSLGLNSVQSRLTVSQMIKSNIFFTITAPIGVGIGMAIMEMEITVTQALLSGSLQGIACGTFLYVTFFEVLPHELNYRENRILKLLFVILGFSIVCAQMIFDPTNQVDEFEKN